MNLENILKRAFRLDLLLRQKQTGNINELAAKLEISKRQAYKYLKAFRTIGRNNSFDTERRSYTYTDDDVTND